MVRIFLKSQAMEPGYPCNHRSVAIYLEDPNVTLTSLHNKYKSECQERQVRILSYEIFRRIIKLILPTLHLGRTRTDVCNACFSLDLQIKDPQTSPALQEELLLAKQMHLDEAIAMRRKIKAIYTSVQETVAPDDPLLMVEPITIPPCFADPFSRLNRPFLVDGNVELGLEEEDEENHSQPDENDIELDEENHSHPDENDIEIDEENPGAENVVSAESSRKLRVTVQDYGAGIALPRYGGSQPNGDYYASNLTLNNMNFVNCANGECDIYYYDERVAGKDGNSVTSIRWKNLCQFITDKKENLPTAEVKILDNCVGQNKSNVTHKFSMLESILIFPEGVTDIYFKVGHSHNASDMKTAHANKAMAKKNLYTPLMIAMEINKSKGLRGEVINENDGVFHDWKTLLDKHFPNMDLGFTKYHWFEFKNGIVHYKSLDEKGDVTIVKSKTFSANPDATKKAVLREIFNLSQTSSPFEIARAKIRLPPLPVRKVSDKKVDNMKVIYPLIPRCYRWYYPEGASSADEPHTELRRRAVAVLQARGAEDSLVGTASPSDELTEIAQEDPGDTIAIVASQEASAAVPDEFWNDAASTSNGVVPVTEKKKAGGRPRLGSNLMKNQPAILRYLAPPQEISQASLGKDATDSNHLKASKRRRRIFFADSSDDDDTDVNGNVQVSKGSSEN